MKSYITLSKIFFVIIFANIFTPILYSKYYSQFKQDEFVNNTFFKNKKNGVFIDIGANDGVKFSNTYFFEEELQWRGICIEPVPNTFKLLKKNRNCICMNVGISDKVGTFDFFYFEGPGLLNMFSGLVSSYSPSYLERISARAEKLGGSLKIITISCRVLNEILEQHNIFYVDYLSIDTEGGELGILKSIDFDRFDIEIIDVENNHKSPEFRSFLEGKGYKYITRLGVDDVFQKIRGS